MRIEDIIVTIVGIGAYITHMRLDFRLIDYKDCVHTLHTYMRY